VTWEARNKCGVFVTPRHMSSTTQRENGIEVMANFQMKMGRSSILLKNEIVNILL
jgi:hypothetical protein